MRFFLVVVIWVVIVGGLWGYVLQRDSRRLQPSVQTQADLSVAKSFAVEITPTFSIEKDPFALTTTDEPVLSLEIRLNGNTLSLPSEELLRGQTVRIDRVTGIQAGYNEILINASPPLQESSLEHGVRVKLIEGDSIEVDETLWAAQGALVSGTISFDYVPKEGE